MKFWPDKDKREPIWIPLMVGTGFYMAFTWFGMVHEHGLPEQPVSLLLWGLVIYLVFGLFTLRTPKCRIEQRKREAEKFQAMVDADYAKWKSTQLVNLDGAGI